MIYDFFPQLEVTASDMGDPEKKSTATVTINVDRDQYKPEIEASYNTTIPDSYEVNKTVVTVRAFDRDLKVSKFSLSLPDISPD